MGSDSVDSWMPDTKLFMVNLVASAQCGLGITTMWSPEKPAGSVPDSAVDHHGQSGSHGRVGFKILLKITALPNLSINFAVFSQ